MATGGNDESRKKDLESTMDFLTFYEEEINKLQPKFSQFSLLAAGKTGVGKSTLLNALTESQEFYSSGDRSKAGTAVITKYEFDKSGVCITAWDSPGFQDSSGKEEVYKEELTAHCSTVDVLIYCMSMKEVKAADLGDDAGALKQITAALTRDVWKKAVIVLTQANVFERRLKTKNVPNLVASFNEKVVEWKVKVQSALRDIGVEEEVVTSLPVVPVGHVRSKHLPGCKLWLSKLWLSVYQAIGDVDAQNAFNKANRSRFSSSEGGSNFMLVFAIERWIDMLKSLFERLTSKDHKKKKTQ